MMLFGLDHLPLDQQFDQIVVKSDVVPHALRCFGSDLTDIEELMRRFEKWTVEFVQEQGVNNDLVRKELLSILDLTMRGFLMRNTLGVSWKYQLICDETVNAADTIDESLTYMLIFQFGVMSGCVNLKRTIPLRRTE